MTFDVNNFLLLLNIEPLDPINMQVRDGLWRACKIFNNDAFARKSSRCWIRGGSGYGHLWKGDDDQNPSEMSDTCWKYFC